MKYAVIVWYSRSDLITGTSNGIVYGWYESLATALNTATNLNQGGTVWQATAVKML